jgi:hypothetical protein
MKNLKILTLFALIGLSPVFCSAGDPPSLKQGQNMLASREWGFLENRGQLKDENGNLLTDVKYYGHQGGISLYCKPGMLSFVFTKVEFEDQISEATGQPMPDKPGKDAPKPSKIYAERAELELLNANLKAKIIASEEQAYYENYYTTGDANHGITNVHTNKTLTYQEIYPHIDLVLHAQSNGMKYEFVVRPGGRVSDIKMQWNGLKNIKSLENGGISYACSLGGMQETAPVSYQQGIEGRQLVISSYSRQGSQISFSTGRYDKTKTLMIDPALVWGTYYGGMNIDESRAITRDGNNNLYITGESLSQNGIATGGAYQESLSGTFDVFVVKFSSSGSLSWGTYYGGSKDDDGYGITSDSDNNVYITGQTASTAGIATTGAYQASIKGTDAFVAIFTPGGGLIGATYYGGNSFDYGRSISLDADKNIVITGWTSSSSGLATSGAYQKVYGSGGYDAFVAKFASFQSLSWSTYFGGASDDRGADINTDRDNNIYITGKTYSTSAIASSGAYQSVLAGDGDVFVAKFAPSGSLSWATYYGGEADDNGLGITSDSSNNIYITGSTLSATGIATSGAHQQTNAGTYDAFIAEFTSFGQLSHATYFGGSAEEYSYDITTDAADNVYITGYSRSLSGIATADAYQTKNGGSYDAFAAKFTSSGQLSWASYFGGNKDEIGYGIATDTHSNVYVAGFTESPGVFLPDAYQPSFAGKDDAFLIKIGLPQKNNDAGLIPYPSPFGSVCSGRRVVSVNLKNYAGKALTSVHINLKINGLAQTPYAWSGNLGYNNSAAVKIGSFIIPTGPDTLIAWTSDPNGVPDSTAANDTLEWNITGNPSPSADAGKSDTICLGQNIMIGEARIPRYSYRWTSKPAGFSSTASNPVVSPVVTTTYYLTVGNDNGCSDSDSVTIMVNPVRKPVITGDKNICAEAEAAYTTNSYTGSIYKWSIAGGAIQAGQGTNAVTVKWSGQSNSAWIKVNETNAGACDCTDSIAIKVNPLPFGKLTVSESGIRQYHFSFSNAGYQNYEWDFGDGEKLGGPAETDHTYKDRGIYPVILKVTDAAGCSILVDTTLNFSTSIQSSENNILYGWQIYPNPFSESATLQYTLNKSTSVSMILTDLTGKEISRIEDVAMKQPGSYTYVLSASDFHLEPSVYIVKMQAGDYIKSQKLIYLK